jgi:3',5'-cyclic AMP phosphodiesterase CpdA
MNRRISVLALVLSASLAGRTVTAQSTASQGAAPRATIGAASSALPDKSGSLKFAVIGDWGDESPGQMATAVQIAKTHNAFPFEIVVTAGDNIYGTERPQDFKNKFETPYKPLLDDHVKFYASLGNHDAQEQRFYKPFNMDGKLYYSFKAPHQDVRFFMLNSSYMDPDQVRWLEHELQTSTERWKIAVFHHPLYSSARAHGSSLSLRSTLEPMFVKYGVSVVLTGHDHTYERIKPQQGITYFVLGSAGELRRGDLAKTEMTALGFDTDNVFLVAEIIDNMMYFNAISRTGAVVDFGTIEARTAPKP